MSIKGYHSTVTFQGQVLPFTEDVAFPASSELSGDKAFEDKISSVIRKIRHSRERSSDNPILFMGERAAAYLVPIMKRHERRLARKARMRRLNKRK